MTPEEFAKLATQMASAVEKVNGVDARLEEAIKKMGGQYEKLGHDLSSLERALNAQYGKSGTLDWKREFDGWLKAAYQMQRHGKVLPAFKKFEHWLDGGQVPQGEKVDMRGVDLDVEKTRVDFTSTVAGTAGYFVPTLIWDGIVPIRDLYGTILPRCTQITVGPGASHRIPTDALLPVAAFMSQGATAMIEEPTPMTFGAQTLVPQWCGTWISIQNELLESAQSNVASIFALRLLRAVIKREELSILQGSSAPHDGLLVVSGTNDQTNIGGATLAYQSTFFSESVADVESLYDTSNTIIVTTPAKAVLLMASTVGASELTGAFSWGSPRDGVPPTLFGFPFIAHPAALISTTHWQTMFHPEDVVVGIDGPAAIDFNPHFKWTHNQTLMRVMQHFDFAVGIPGRVSKADYS